MTDPDPDGVVAALEQLCTATSARLEILGATVTLMPSAGAHVVAASSPTVRRLEDLQFAAGEGPTQTAFQARRLVLATFDDTGMTRWPGWGPDAGGAGVSAVGAFPLQVGAAIFGVFTVYSRTVLGPDRVSAALVAADHATDLIVDRAMFQDGRRLAVDLDASLSATLDTHTHVYQAQGMVMVDLAVTLAEALILMRAHAWATGQALTMLASDIVAGRTRLPRDKPDQSGHSGDN